MRPLRLRLKGFTSFRDEQELDFRNLEVFAITGPTGAGKSSLLDALTYALYGEVERVGRECGQLVSHGFARMAVTLDFEVDHHEFRITRTTPAKTGPSKVLLERYVAGEWRSYGEGADRVRDVNEYVKKLIGLDYSAFTRSVLLPQGKFAEFMAGKPEERRAIISDLLGLGLFKRMAQRAGRLASDAENLARAKRDILNTQFAHVTPEALQSARSLAEASSKRLAALDEATRAVSALVEEWRTEQARAKELANSASDLRAWRTKLCSAVDAAQALAEKLGVDMRDIGNVETRVEDLRLSAEKAQLDRADAELRWGSAVELATALATARQLPERRQHIAEKLRAVEDLSARQPTLVAALAKASGSLGAQLASVTAAEQALETARQRERDMEHANMAAALAADLDVGDPCPVCGEPLERLPEAPAAPELAEAGRAVRAAEKAVTAAQKSASDAEREVDRLKRDIQEDEKSVARVSAEIETLRGAAARAEQEVSAALRGPLPDHPTAVLNERISTLQTLRLREEKAGTELANAKQLHSQLISAVAVERERLTAQRNILLDPGRTLITRALTAIDGAAEPTWPESPSTESEPEELVSFGNAKVRILDAFTAELHRRAAEASCAESRLLECARESIGDFLPAYPTLSATAESLARAKSETVAQHAAAVQRTELLAEALRNRVTLESEIAEHTRDAVRYQSLATDLRADRLIAFLQDEALTTLAQAGSRHLFGLSGQRYELAVDRDFYVVDKWSADEKRSVRTLSGGETFLASLSLALALSEQVRALSVTERARLDSLFLDEGFGTLDPETLRVVVDAINDLSGGGRLVGVITHVPELAQEFPRIEVTKSPAGSHLVLQS